MKNIKVLNVGPIAEADITLGDLTVFVGPQAVGKSILLQTIKLVQDTGYIKASLNQYGYLTKTDWEKFLSLYYGEGMKHIWNNESKIRYDGKEFNPETFTKSRKTGVKTFYIPAQRVITIENGWAKPFAAFDAAYPYVTREFSENIRVFMDRVLRDASGKLFPKENKLKKEFRSILADHIFHGSEIKLSEFGNRKTLSMKLPGGGNLTIPTWSAGQREFTPLLMGLYWAFPSGNASKKKDLETIIVEEPEMALHPKGIVSTLLLIMELISRGYRVILSTHSNTVLEVVWAIREIQSKDKDPEKFLAIFGAEKYKNTLKGFAEKCLSKEYKTYYFMPDVKGTKVTDISKLDPGSENKAESTWGGLTEYSSALTDLVSKLYNYEN
jgi:energy-coupling factor transporter ATP-binding protein EcfA2